jgi:hypothetical protein
MLHSIPLRSLELRAKYPEFLKGDDQMFDLAGNEPLTEPTLEDVPEASPQIARSAKELGRQHQVSDRTIQAWYGVVTRAYCWLPEPTFKVGNSNRTRYTPEFQCLVKQFRQSGLSAEDWVTQIHQANPALYQQTVKSTQYQAQQHRYSSFGLEPQAVTAEVVDETSSTGGLIVETPQHFQAQPLVQLKIQTLNITLPEGNTTRLEQNTAQLQAQTIAALGSIQQAVTADFSTKLGAVLAQNTHAVAAMQNAAVIQAAETLGLATPVVATTDPD